MFQRLFSFLSKSNCFNSNQHGFTKGKSTESAIIEFLDKLYEYLDNKKNCIGLFLDLSKAFDLFNHNKLLDKLWRCGIRGSSLNWFKSYLENRQHYLEIDNSKSNLLLTNSGVPQGSVLGPLLYIIYVSDFNCLDAVMFADDTSVLISAERQQNLPDIAIKKLNNLETYFLENSLYVNHNKTVFLNFTNSKQDIEHSWLIRSKANNSIKQIDQT